MYSSLIILSEKLTTNSIFSPNQAEKYQGKRYIGGGGGN
jgi:hypothetical protein